MADHHRDDYNPADYASEGFFDELTGDFHPPRRAGDRYTGPRMHRTVDGFLEHDALAYMGMFRKMLVARRAESEPITDYQWDWMKSNRRHHYELQRMRAYRKSSRLLQAEMLALSARCVSRVDEMKAASA